MAHLTPTPPPHPEVGVCATNIFTGSDIAAANTLALLASHPVSVQKFDIITPRV